MVVMGQASDPGVVALPEKSAQTFVDRWIYVFMAAWLTVVVLAGFLPDSIQKIALLQQGKRAPFPMILHVHAVLMGAWMVLLLTQTTLMATGRRAMHMQLGVAGMVLAPLLVIVGTILVPTNARAYLEFAQAAPEEIRAEIPERLRFIGNIALLQLRIAVCFLGLVLIALRVRKTDSGTHKRLMILATSVPLPAALDRIQWLPHTLPASPISADLWPLACIAPMFVWDLYRSRTVPKAYLIWAAFMVPGALFVNLLWDNPGWHEFAHGLIVG